MNQRETLQQETDDFLQKTNIPIKSINNIPESQVQSIKDLPEYKQLIESVRNQIKEQTQIFDTINNNKENIKKGTIKMIEKEFEKLKQTPMEKLSPVATRLAQATEKMVEQLGGNTETEDSVYELDAEDEFSDEEM